MNRKKGLSALLTGILVMGLTGCGGEAEVADTPNQSVMEETENSSLETTPAVVSVDEIFESMETDEMVAMGLVQYDTLDDLTANLNYNALTLDIVSPDVIKDTYEIQELATEFGNATIRYKANTGEDGKLIVIRSGYTENMQTFVQGRTSEADVVVGETIVISMTKNDEAKTITGWWTSGDLTYTVDMENLTLEEFSDIVIALAESTL